MGCSRLSFMKLSANGANVAELVYTLEMEVLSTLINFRSI